MILAFDTSGPYCAVALLNEGAIVFDAHEDMAKGQAERLFPLLEECLAKTDRTWDDLEAIAVGTGPGNFTGIRIGVSAARGLALGLGIPAIGVTSFDALAHAAKPVPSLFVLSAPRAQIYALGHCGIGPSEITLTSVDQITGLSPETLVIGENSAEIAAQLGCQHAPSVYAPASAIARVAVTRVGEAIEPAKPFYMRPPDAAPSADPPPVILP